jgi:predicted Rossmann-fold nucleotide-binding protein
VVRCDGGRQSRLFVSARSIDLNITLPHGAISSPYISPELCFRFHYFAMPATFNAGPRVGGFGGFGTFDELFRR